MNNIVSQEEKDKIDILCKSYKIHKYTINGDGSIDVDDNVNLNNRDIINLELNFNIVNGDFDCSYSYMNSLKGCPKEVGGDFRCNVNRLTSLEYCPSVVGGSFFCNNNQLTSLEYCPSKISGHFGCSGNKITSFEYFPKEVGDTLAWYGQSLPESFQVVSELPKDEQQIFMKYQSYYYVWTPKFNEEGMNELIAEIKDGLR
jgi:hypothetical protein